MSISIARRMRMERLRFEVEWMWGSVKPFLRREHMALARQIIHEFERFDELK